MNIRPDVVNFHFTDFCNYSCSYCFVMKSYRQASFLDIQKVVDNIKHYFDIIKVRGRINLVGGEIFMCNYLQDVIDYIHFKGIDISIVTNGSLLTENFIVENKGKIYSIGISVDSLNQYTNICTGRCTKNQTLSLEKLVKICKLIKKNGIKLKINHCVSKYNVNEDILDLIKKVLPDRFKIFQMTIVDGINNNMKDMQISEREFESYCSKYSSFHPIIEKEKEMKKSYLMIDSEADIYIDRSCSAIGNALINDLYSVLSTSCIDEASYLKRYIQLQG